MGQSKICFIGDFFVRLNTWLVLFLSFASFNTQANLEHDWVLRHVQYAPVHTETAAEVDSFSAEFPLPHDNAALFTGGELHRHWRNPQFELMGESQYTSDRGRENIGVAANNLIHVDHLLNLDYRVSDAMKAQDHSAGFGLNYAFPFANNWFEVGFSHSEYENTVVSSDNRYDASSESRVFNFTGRRSLREWRYLRLDGTVKFTNRDARKYQEGHWVEETHHQVSRFQLDGRSRYDLAFDMLATTQVSVVGGMDVNGAEYNAKDSYAEDDSFHKFVVAAALSRDLWFWTLGVSGRYQFTPDDIPSSEYMKIAGSGLISGFSGHSMSSPVGGWLRVDASSPSFVVPFTSHLLSSVRVAVLRGWMPENLDDRHRYDTASAAEFSLGVQARGLNADISVGHMLGDSKLTSVTSDMPDISLSLSLGI